MLAWAVPLRYYRAQGVPVLRTATATENPVALRRRRMWFVAFLFVVALCVRIQRAYLQPVVNPDCIRFVLQAKELPVNPLMAVRKEVYHPLQSVCGLLVHTLFVRPLLGAGRRGWLISMQTVGIVAGAVVAVLLIELARRLGAPWWAACVAAVAFTVGRRTSGYGADGISDMLFLMFFTAALLAGMRTRLQWRPAGWILAGVLTGFSYLTRPEGVAAVMILTGALFFRWTQVLGPKAQRWPRAPFWRPNGRATFLRCASLMLAAYFVIGLPYMIAIGGFTGKKPLLKDVDKVQVAPLALPRVGPAMVAVKRPTMATLAVVRPEIWGKIWQEVFETFGFGPFIVLGIAVALKPKVWAWPHWRPMCAVWAALWITVMAWLLERAKYLDGRHTLVLDLLLFCFFAMSLDVWRWAMGNWQKAWVRRGWIEKMPKFAGWVYLPEATAFSLAVLAATPGAVRLDLPPVEGLDFMRNAARWLHQHAARDVVVADNQRLLGYYSGLGYMYWMGRPGKPLFAELKDAKPGTPLIIDYIFETQRNGDVPNHFGPYRELMWKGRPVLFRSHASAHDDVLVLYALPGAPVLKTPVLRTRPTTAGVAQGKKK